MKNKHFYEFLVETTNITLDLGDMDLTSEERVHLLSLIDANIHSSVVKVVLENLDSENKKVFLKNLTSDNHNRTWSHLESNIVGSEKLIKKIIAETLDEIRKDIKNSKNQER